MSLDEYLDYQKNAIQVGSKLQCGYYTNKVMESAIDYLRLDN